MKAAMKLHLGCGSNTQEKLLNMSEAILDRLPADRPHERLRSRESRQLSLRSRKCNLAKAGFRTLRNLKTPVMCLAASEFALRGSIRLWDRSDANKLKL